MEADEVWSEVWALLSLRCEALDNTGEGGLNLHGTMTSVRSAAELRVEFLITAVKVRGGAELKPDTPPQERRQKPGRQLTKFALAL